MTYSEKLINEKAKLHQKYLDLVEHAYNIMFTDEALSSIEEYKALQLHLRLEKLDFV